MLMEINHREAAPGVVAVVLSGRVMMGPESEQIVGLSKLGSGFRRKLW